MDKGGSPISMYNLYMDFADGGGNVNLANVADARVSLAVLFIRSNVAGFAVSAGWLLIRGEF